MRPTLSLCVSRLPQLFLNGPLSSLNSVFPRSVNVTKYMLQSGGEFRRRECQWATFYCIPETEDVLCVLRPGDHRQSLFSQGMVCVCVCWDGGVGPCGAADGMLDQVYRLLFRVLETPSVNRRVYVGGTFRRVW